jgi:hypothetical protein
VTGPARDEPWLKWVDELESDYAHFQCYRDLPPVRRTLENAYLVWSGQAYTGDDRPPPDAMGRRARFPRSWQGQYRKWHWEQRAAKFDVWREKTQLEAERDGTLQAWREMGERHAREAMALQQKALERLRTLNPQELTAAEVRQFLVQAATLERLARGASLQDMARVQREREQEAAKDGVAVITYVDDWRGDAARSRRNQNSFYGNGQGALPSMPTPTPKAEEKKPRGPRKPRQPVEGLPLVRPDGSPAEGELANRFRPRPERVEAEVPLPGPPPGPGGGDAAP